MGYNDETGTWTPDRLHDSVTKYLTAKEATEFLSQEIRKLQQLKRGALSVLRDAQRSMESLVDYRGSTQSGFGVEDCIELYGDFQFDG